MAPGVAVTPQNGVTMNIFRRIAYRWRATRINLLRADIRDIERKIRWLERQQLEAFPVPAFLRKRP